MTFSAKEPTANATIAQGRDVIAQATAAGYGTGTLYVQPFEEDASPAGGLIPEADFAAKGVPTDQPIYLSFAMSSIPSDPTIGNGCFSVAAVLQGLSQGMSFKQLLGA